jgi:hypothetical protein
MEGLIIYSLSQMLDCQHDNLKTIKRIKTKICGTNGHFSMTNGLNFA